MTSSCASQIWLNVTEVRGCTAVSLIPLGWLGGNSDVAKSHFCDINARSRLTASYCLIFSCLKPSETKIHAKSFFFCVCVGNELSVCSKSIRDLEITWLLAVWREKDA